MNFSVGIKMQHGIDLISTGDELVQAFAAIPVTVTKLSLVKNNLGKIAAAELAQAFAVLPETLTSLDLSRNNLSAKSVEALVLIFKAIPKTITSIDLSSNELFTNKSIEEREALLLALNAVNPDGSRFILSNNGESPIAKNRAPMIDIVRQTRLLIDVVNKILAQLCPNANILK